MLDIPESISIVLKLKLGLKVLTALGNVQRPDSMLVGMPYAVNLSNPKELKYMFKVFQETPPQAALFKL